MFTVIDLMQKQIFKQLRTQQLPIRKGIVKLWPKFREKNIVKLQVRSKVQGPGPVHGPVHGLGPGLISKFNV